jgi:membrane-associated phospholipid phosphatase
MAKALCQILGAIRLRFQPGFLRHRKANGGNAGTARTAASNRRMKAALTSMALTILFLIVYPFCNWITSLRTHVGSLYFAWERHIPFVPLFIIPYMSMDFFFVGAPFLIPPDRLTTFTKRMVAATLVSAVCFLLIPLRFAFHRPAVHGFLGLIFHCFDVMDKPFNEFPSLHITYCITLANVYLRQTRSALRAALAIWFTLIAASTLLTYQHHVVDVLGGAALAILLFKFIRNPSSCESSPAA